MLFVQAKALVKINILEDSFYSKQNNNNNWCVLQIWIP